MNPNPNLHLPISMSHFGRSGPPDISDSYSLLVSNITIRTTGDDLYSIFIKYGEIVDVFLPRYRTGDPRGLAFVRYKNEDEAQEAESKLDGTIIDGHRIRVEFAKYGRKAEKIYKGKISKALPKSKHRSRSRSPHRWRSKNISPNQSSPDYSKGRGRGHYEDERKSRSRSRGRRCSVDNRRVSERKRKRDYRWQSRNISPKQSSPDYSKGRGRGRYEDERKSRSRSCSRGRRCSVDNRRVSDAGKVGTSVPNSLVLITPRGGEEVVMKMSRKVEDEAVVVPWVIGV